MGTVSIVCNICMCWINRNAGQIQWCTIYEAIESKKKRLHETFFFSSTKKDPKPSPLFRPVCTRPHLSGKGCIATQYLRCSSSLISCERIARYGQHTNQGRLIADNVLEDFVATIDSRRLTQPRSATCNGTLHADIFFLVSVIFTCGSHL